MSWSEIWEAVLRGERVGSVEAADNADDLPFGLQLGSTVRLQKTPFFRAVGNGGLVPVIDDASPEITSVSRIKLSNGMLIHRLFLASSGADPDNAFLLVLHDRYGRAAQLSYCRPLTRVAAGGAPERAQFERLGERAYALLRSELTDLGFEEAVLSGVMGDADSLEYIRDGGGEAYFLAPMEGGETRIADVGGFVGRERDVWLAPYVRSIGPDQEFLIILAAVQRQDTTVIEPTLSAEFSLGIPLDISRFVATQH